MKKMKKSHTECDSTSFDDLPDDNVYQILSKRRMISYSGEKFTQTRSCLSPPYETIQQRVSNSENVLHKSLEYSYVDDDFGDEEEGAYNEAMKEMLKELKRRK
uniref:Uncharacterized protein n=1 Tax=Tanacetum cinerariifolium TaxID=118510 RepID=A0A6L2NRE4_TANCI|nr:hypothetical protein [Tanacetum cinerariifolium]